tara:strand:- start:711 stop:974 length:264 start_codon:yes stop_codon:yes gene_type:complete
MNDKELCQWLRGNSSGVYRPSAEAADRIEALNRELAELKANIPQIKHDAIMEARDATREDGFFDEGESCSVLDLTQYAQTALTQAKE